MFIDSGHKRMSKSLLDDRILRQDDMKTSSNDLSFVAIFIGWYRNSTESAWFLQNLQLGSRDSAKYDIRKLGSEQSKIIDSGCSLRIPPAYGTSTAQHSAKVFVFAPDQNEASELFTIKKVFGDNL